MRIKEKSKKDKNILIIGSGFAGISFYKEFHKLIHERSDIKITILSENNYFLFTPLLHEVATGNLLPEDIITPIRENFFCCTREIIIDKALYIDVLKKQVKLKKTSVDYDYLVIATGASTNFFNIKGVKEYAYPLKDIHDSIRLKNGIVSLFEKAEMEKWKKIDVVLVGGGATGIELSVEISEFIEQLKPYYKNLREEDVELRVKILNASENFIPDFPQKVRKKVLSFFSNINSKVSIVLNSRVKVVEENKVILDNRKAVNYDFLVWSAGVKPIIPSNNLGIDVLKRIPVNQFLQTESENVFANSGVFSHIFFVIPSPSSKAERNSSASSRWTAYP